jgi:glycosyltransferase involved in cell wall biosynthesis
MVGGRADQLESLRAMAVQEGVEEHFLFTGPQPFENIPVFLGISDLLVSPRSHGTNTPLKIYSYLASGKPIVATDMQTHRQVLTDETAMLVPPDAEGLGEGIRRLLGDAALRERIGQDGWQLARESFSYRTYLSRIQEAFDYVNGRAAEGIPVPDRSAVT